MYVKKYGLICFKFCFGVNLNVNSVCLIMKLKSVYCIPNLSPKPTEDLSSEIKSYWMYGSHSSDYEQYYNLGCAYEM
jgi:hypothetical protein